MKIRKGTFSGILGNEVYVNTKHGQVVRSRPDRPGRRTPGRQRSWEALCRVAWAWRDRTDDQFEAWALLAQRVNRESPAGTSTHFTPYSMFCKINGALAAARLPVRMDPPRQEKLGPNPVGKLDILNEGDEVRLLLEVPRAPEGLIFVLASRPVSRGRSVCSSFSTIGLLPAAADGWSEITALYVARYGVPPARTRVFIRTRQLLNGWEDDFKETNAVVPAPSSSGRSGQGR